MEMVLKFSLLTIAIIIFAISKAICDISESSFANSKLGKLNPLFWDKHKSWKNKWKGGVAANGEKFFGSSTFLVWITDAWHLFNALSYLSLFLSGVLLASMNVRIIFIPLVYLLSFSIFEFSYRYLKK